MQLAIDTSTEFASLALVQEADVLAELNWHCGQNHTVELLPRLDFLLQKAGHRVNEIDCIFVARGPGSFNGLRVGVAAAKGLSLALVIPIIAVGTLAVTAYPHSQAGLPVFALQNAGREEIVAAAYQNKPRKGWTQLVAEHITTLSALLTGIKDRTIVCGEFDRTMARQIQATLKTRVRVPGPAARLRRAAFLAELGQLRRQQGDFDNPAILQPLYLRRPPITERKKK